VSIETLNARELIQLWRETRQSYARGPVVLAHVMDLGSKLVDALQVSESAARDAFEAGFRARPVSVEQWTQHELTGEPRQFEFSAGGSAEDLLSEAWVAYSKVRGR
jgi:hypothetical protein